MSRLRFEACALAILLGGASRAQVTQRVSVSSGEVQGNGQSYALPDLR